MKMKAECLIKGMKFLYKTGNNLREYFIYVKTEEVGRTIHFCSRDSERISYIFVLNKDEVVEVINHN